MIVDLLFGFGCFVSLVSFLCIWRIVERIKKLLKESGGNFSKICILEKRMDTMSKRNLSLEEKIKNILFLVKRKGDNFVHADFKDLKVVIDDTFKYLQDGDKKIN